MTKQLATGVNNLRVGGTTDAKKLAGSIAIECSKNNAVTITYIGASAANIAQKGLAIARGLTTPQGMDLWSQPTFTTINIVEEEKERTGIMLLVEDKSRI